MNISDSPDLDTAFFWINETPSIKQKSKTENNTTKKEHNNNGNNRKSDS